MQQLAPVLLGHDHDGPILGAVYLKDSKLIIKIEPEHKMTEKVFFDTFGNCGVNVIDADFDPDTEELYIIEAQLMEFSLDTSI